MKLKDILPPTLYEYITTIDDEEVHFVFEAGSPEHALFEARHKGDPMGGQYSVIFHRAHVAGTQDHLHMFVKQNQLGAINMDGSAHDQSHGVRIPNRLADAIRARFPEFIVPPNNLIEGAEPYIATEYRRLILG